MAGFERKIVKNNLKIILCLINNFSGQEIIIFKCRRLCVSSLNAFVIVCTGCVNFSECDHVC